MVTTWGLWHFRPLTTWGTCSQQLWGVSKRSVYMGKTYKSLRGFMTCLFGSKSWKKDSFQSCPLFFYGTFANKNIKLVQSEIFFCPSKSTVWKWLFHSLWWDKFDGYPNKSSPRNGKQRRLRAKLKQRAKQPAFHVMECSIFRVTLFGV